MTKSLNEAAGHIQGMLFSSSEDQTPAELLCSPRLPRQDSLRISPTAVRQVERRLAQDRRPSSSCHSIEALRSHNRKVWVPLSWLCKRRAPILHAQCSSAHSYLTAPLRAVSVLNSLHSRRGTGDLSQLWVASGRNGWKADVPREPDGAKEKGGPDTPTETRGRPS